MFDVGFTAGLRLWLIFLLSFFLLGQSAGMSIFLGAIAGIAGGLIAAWNSAGNKPPIQFISDSDPEKQDQIVTNDRWSQWRRSRQERDRQREPGFWSRVVSRGQRGLSKPRR